MLAELQKALTVLPELMEEKDQWGSLVINRRKPFTYRAFRQWGDLRVCLHRFETCDEAETFYHPHPWAGAFKLLKGSYEMKLGYSASRISPPNHVATVILTAGSSYEINEPLTWHTVQPLSECFTVMVNSEPWPSNVAHAQVKTTKGKDLQAMTPNELSDHFATFKSLLEFPIPYDPRAFFTIYE